MHIKGCQKRVIVLSSPACEWIEQAYFILKENTELPPPAEKDMVKAAQKLLLSALTEPERIKREKKRQCFRFACFFLAGVLFAFSGYLIFSLF